MELSKKLNIFYTSAIEVANKQSRDVMQEFAISMERLKEEFQKNKKLEMDSRFRVEEGKLKREMNRRVSVAVTDQKRRLNLHQQEKKEALFAVVEWKLQEFQKTAEYDQYLISKIRMAHNFAREESVVIYLNPTDANKKVYLEQETGCELTVSERNFGGGIRAVVRSKNVLIDESFQTKLKQEREAYAF